MADNIADKVKEIIIQNLNVPGENVTPEAKFIEDLGADSLDTVELVMAFEEEFGIEVADEEAEKLVSVGAVISHIESIKGE
ncbi:MAG: acyl carrier protein [Verrucomicrobiales bacterium]|nr:acyl carrier protein [Verrucomicrobiales bacterium]